MVLEREREWFISLFSTQQHFIYSTLIVCDSVCDFPLFFCLFSFALLNRFFFLCVFYFFISSFRFFSWVLTTLSFFCYINTWYFHDIFFSTFFFIFSMLCHCFRGGVSFITRQICAPDSSKRWCRWNKILFNSYKNTMYTYNYTTTV